MSSLFLTFAQVLLSHVVPGALMSGDISDDMITPSAGGGQLRANIYLKSDFCSAQHCLDLWTIRHAIRYAIRYAIRHAIRYAIRHATRHAIRHA